MSRETINQESIQRSPEAANIEERDRRISSLKEQADQELPKLAEQEILESIIDVPESCREYVAVIKRELENIVLQINQYKIEEADWHDLPEDEKKERINNFRTDPGIPSSWPFFAKYTEIRNRFELLQNKLGFREAEYEGVKKADSPNARYQPEQRKKELFEETIELAMLASSDDVRQKLQEIDSFCQKTMPGYYESNFIERMEDLPKKDPEKIKEWLLRPISRVAHSIFTHMTSTGALDSMLADNALRSSSLNPNANETGRGGAYIKSKVVSFDRNHFSSYGTNAETAYKKFKKLLLITRGDVLLRDGYVVDSATFFRPKPWSNKHEMGGSGVVSSSRNGDYEGTNIPLVEFVAQVDSNDNDLRQKVSGGKFAAIIDELEKLTTRPEQADIGQTRDLVKKANSIFGQVEIPQYVISRANETQISEHHFYFPNLVKLRQ